MNKAVRILLHYRGHALQPVIAAIQLYRNVRPEQRYVTRGIPAIS
jgi:hypothetical protein